MATKNGARRFGAHEVTRGPYKGGLHVAGDRYKKFFSELISVSLYLEKRIIPSAPEEVSMRSIVLNLQNIIEHESEELIRQFVKDHLTNRNKKFAKEMSEGYISAKLKRPCQRMFAKWGHHKSLQLAV